MTRPVFVILLLLFIAACAVAVHPPVPLPGVFVLYAQTLPITKTATWNAPIVDATHAAADSYTVRLDGIVVGSPTTTTQAVTFTTNGAHTVTVTATNQWGTSGPLALSVLVAPPNTISGLTLQ